MDCRACDKIVKFFEERDIYLDDHPIVTPGNVADLVRYSYGSLECKLDAAMSRIKGMETELRRVDAERDFFYVEYKKAEEKAGALIDEKLRQHLVEAERRWLTENPPSQKQAEGVSKDG